MTGGRRGFALAEVLFATAIAGTFIGAVAIAGGAHLAFIAASFDETVARRAAAARLEEAIARPERLAPGARGFAVDALPGARGEEEVREVEPGLLAVLVRVSWKTAGIEGERALDLATLVAREEGPR